MLDWYLGLSTLVWVLLTVPFVFAILGAIIIFSARSIAKSFDHDRTICPCRECEKYRVRQINARNKTHRPITYAGQMISTRELGSGMVVTAKKNANTYVVEAVNIRTYGYAIQLTNLQSNRASWVTIMHSRAHLKQWKVADGRPHRIHAL